MFPRGIIGSALSLLIAVAPLPVWAVGGRAGTASKAGAGSLSARPAPGTPWRIWRPADLRRPGLRRHDHDSHRHPRPPVIVVWPYSYHSFYYQPYYRHYHLPVTVVTKLSFYCFSHQVGFVSRIGMIDHLSASHDVPIDSAAALCGESDPGCVIDVITGL